MSETPDFEKITERIALRTGAFQATLPDVVAEVAEQLRQVWNARGAADIAKVEEVYSHASLKAMESALRSLDR